MNAKYVEKSYELQVLDFAFLVFAVMSLTIISVIPNKFSDISLSGKRDYV